MTTGVTLAFPMMQKIIVRDILKLHFGKILWRDIFAIVNGTKVGIHSPKSTSCKFNLPLLISYLAQFFVTWFLNSYCGIRKYQFI